jgi:hypothetical protein
VHLVLEHVPDQALALPDILDENVMLALIVANLLLQLLRYDGFPE